MNGLAKACVAEFIGTFVLVFWGSAAVALNPPGASAVMPALAHGLALVFAAYALGHWSGAHVNPAITLSVWIKGAIDARDAVAYIATQIIAAVVAAAVLNVILTGQAENFGAFSFEAGNGSAATAAALLLELILTFCLATVVLQAAVAGKAGNMAGLAIGLTLAGCILAGGAVTGASVNPARTLGPAIVAGQLGQVWVYLVGTLLGGALAALVSRFVLVEKANVG